MSFWRWIGRLYGLFRMGRRSGADRRESAEAAAAAAIVVEIGAFLTEAVEEVVNKTRQSRPFSFPPLPPSKKTELLMPSFEPEPRVRAPNPPFTGVRVALGET